MASFCYVCGAATPAGLHRDTGEAITTTMRSGIGPADLIRKLQRALGPGYELQDRIGAGGFAEVFKARDLRLKRDLAVKVLRPDLGLSPDLLQRFRREAETIATLRNTHIVPVYDIGEAEGLAFIIMPLISGESLRAVLDRSGPMSPAEVRRILREAALGLAAAHDAGVIHRDIKPENIMLEGREQRVLLMDFGIAKAVGFAGEEGDAGRTLTTTGIIIGTPQYMSPEQACGDKTIDARSDQYSLAVVGYRMLAGGLPFDGESTRAVLYQQLVAEPPPISSRVSGVPPALANAIQRAMSKEPNDRFANMSEFAQALERDTAAIPVSPDLRRRNRRRGGALAASGTALLLIGVAAYALTRPRQPSAVVPPPAPSVAAAQPPAAPVRPPVTDSGGAAAIRSTTLPAPDKTQPAPRKPASPTTPPSRTSGAAPATTGSTAPPPAPATNSCTKLAGSSNWSAALPACTREAEAGSASAARALGNMYDRAQGVPENPAEAVKWYRKAAPSDVESKLLLARMLETGRGAPRNDTEAMVLYREAAMSGNVTAQLTLASRLENPLKGGNVKKDEGEAAVWYRRAAERGDVGAEVKLADILAHGRGVDKNEAEALEWYRKAGDAGSGDAAWQATQMYFKGKGTAKDEATGMDWLRKAAALNQPDAIKELKKRTEKN